MKKAKADSVAAFLLAELPFSTINSLSKTDLISPMYRCRSLESQLVLINDLEAKVDDPMISRLGDDYVWS
jgi:hypothetical protein